MPAAMLPSREITILVFHQQLTIYLRRFIPPPIIPRVHCRRLPIIHRTLICQEQIIRPAPAAILIRATIHLTAMIFPAMSRPDTGILMPVIPIHTITIPILIGPPITRIPMNKPVRRGQTRWSIRTIRTGLLTLIPTAPMSKQTIIIGGSGGKPGWPKPRQIFRNNFEDINHVINLVHPQF